MVLKLNSKNLSTTGFLFLGEVSFLGGGKSREGKKENLLTVKCQEGYQKRRPYNRQSLP